VSDPALRQRLAAVTQLDAASGLRRVLQREPLYVSLLQRFMAQHAEGVAPMRAALTRHDYPTAERLAHTLRGVSASLGATAVPQHAQALEAALRAQAPPGALAPLLDVLDAALRSLLSQLQAALPPQAPATRPVTSPQERAHVQAQLGVLLREDDATSVAYVREHEAVLRDVLHERFDALSTAVEQFEFGDALRVMQTR
jgi:two-component system sensor histidine kinase/response regulator